MHFISITPVLSDHLSYVTIFHCSLGRSHKTGLAVHLKLNAVIWLAIKSCQDLSKRFKTTTWQGFLCQLTYGCRVESNRSVIRCGLLMMVIDWFSVFNATFSNISAISWRPVLVVKEAGVPGENHRSWASNWKTVSQVECTLFVINKAKCEPTPYWW